MAIFHSCCLCCNLRTGSCIAGMYSIVSKTLLNKNAARFKDLVSTAELNNKAVWLIVSTAVLNKKAVGLIVRTSVLNKKAVGLIVSTAVLNKKAVVLIVSRTLLNKKDVAIVGLTVSTTVRKHANEGCTLTLKPRADVTKSPKQG